MKQPGITLPDINILSGDKHPHLDHVTDEELIFELSYRWSQPRDALYYKAEKLLTALSKVGKAMENRE